MPLRSKAWPVRHQLDALSANRTRGRRHPEPDYSSRVAKGRSDRPCAGLDRLGRLDSDVVVHRNPELLLAAEVSFSRLYGHVHEEELDLIQFAACEMTQ